MNYFEHHIRDYDTATQHLTWDQDLAYTRLIRWYYRKEKPVPADVKEACRQVRAVSKAQRDAVAAVLAEFFELRDDGWHNATCDQAIQRFQDGEPEREVKKANEDNRMKRHRDERARLFKVVTDAGMHAPWNIGMTELRTLADRIQATGPATQTPETGTLPVTAPATPATATQSPITNHQSPVLKTKDDDDSTDSNPGERSPSSFDPEIDMPPADDYRPPAAAGLPMRETPPVSDDPAIQIAVALRRQGVIAPFTHPAVQEWAKAAVPLPLLLEAVATARITKGEKAPIPANYLIPIVNDMLNPPAAKPGSAIAAPAKPRKPQGTEPKGPDESYDDWQARVDKAEAARRNRQ